MRALPLLYHILRLFEIPPPPPLATSCKSRYNSFMIDTALLLKEIDTMPEEAAAQVLDFTMFMKGKYAYGIFRDLKGMDTTIERDEDDRV